MKIADLNEV